MAWGSHAEGASHDAGQDDHDVGVGQHHEVGVRGKTSGGSGEALVAVQVPVSLWEKWSPWLFAATLLLLVLVLIPVIGKGVNGARRWIPLGLMNFQPSVR